MSKLVTIASFINPWDAYLAKGKLEDEGIPALIVDEYHVWANWIYAQALGGVKVQVMEENVAAANGILGSVEQGRYEEELRKDFPDLDENNCPNCGSDKYSSRMPLGFLLLAILSCGLLGIIFPLRRDEHRCSRCRHVWKY
ncbi:MAG TPA: DUF2007 domain-containing protein [Gammaproteobacteria bacterium]|nr:DUF2007 domain-containing protein [Gammaproteobacteria bacterium]